MYRFRYKLMPHVPLLLNKGRGVGFIMCTLFLTGNGAGTMESIVGNRLIIYIISQLKMTACDNGYDCLIVDCLFVLLCFL